MENKTMEDNEPALTSRRETIERAGKVIAQRRAERQISTKTQFERARDALARHRRNAWRTWIFYLGGILARWKFICRVLGRSDSILRRAYRVVQRFFSAWHQKSY